MSSEPSWFSYDGRRYRVWGRGLAAGGFRSARLNMLGWAAVLMTGILLGLLASLLSGYSAWLLAVVGVAVSWVSARWIDYLAWRKIQRSPSLHLVNEREREHAEHAQRLVIVDGLLLALDRWPEVIACVWDSGDRQTAHQRLCANLDLSDMVADYVLDLPVGRTTELARHNLAEEAIQLRRGLRDDPL